MFERLSKAQLRNLVYLVARADLREFTVYKKYPAYGTYLQNIDVYAECVNYGVVAKKIFINCEKTDWIIPEIMDAQLEFRDDLIKKGFMEKNRDMFWVVTPGRFDVSCAKYTKIKDIDMKDRDWLIKSVRRYVPHYRELRLYVQTLQSGNLLTSPIL